MKRKVSLFVPLAGILSILLSTITSAQANYNQQAAVAYAEQWCDGLNSSDPGQCDPYKVYDADCANFVSQCLIAGGLDLSWGSDWWWDGCECIISCTELNKYLVNGIGAKQELRVRSEGEPTWLGAGDIIILSVDPNRYQHAMFVVSGNSAQVGDALYSGHTPNQCSVPFNELPTVDDTGKPFNYIHYYDLPDISSKIIYVPDDYSTIQEAVDAANAGDTIIVRDGTYNENVDVNKENITIKSENGADSTIVRALNPGEYMFEIVANHVSLSGFTLRDADIGRPHTSRDGTGIYLMGVGCSIFHNKITNNKLGIDLDGSENNITDNEVWDNKWIGIKLTGTENSMTGNEIWDNDHGIVLGELEDSRIRDNKIRGNIKALWLYNSHNNQISTNTISDNVEGMIFTWNNTSNEIFDNTFTNNGISFDSFVSSYQQTVNNNKVNGKPLVYLQDTSHYKVENAGQVILVNCTAIIVEDLELSNTDVGIQILNTNDCTITNNSISGCPLGINLVSSVNNKIIKNKISECRRSLHVGGTTYYFGGIGISLFSSDKNIVADNEDSRDGAYAIDIYGSRENIIRSNYVPYGMDLCYSSNNTIYFNDCVGFFSYITTWYSNNNIIYLNNFNFSPVENSSNTWNSPEQMNYIFNGNLHIDFLGNYWDYYTGTDSDGDGIGDTPYSIDGDSDNYPLMMPFDNYEIGGEAPPENQAPVADFTCSKNTAKSGEEVTFDASGSTDPDGEIISYEWDFGDGETTTGISVSHRFRGGMNEAKTYAVSLTVRDNGGNTDTHSEDVTVVPLTKTIEIIAPPRPTPGGSAKATAYYNWIGVTNDTQEDIYVVSKISFEGQGFISYLLSIWNEYSLSIGVPAWSEAVIAFWRPVERTYTYQFGTYRDRTYTFYDGNFEGMAVGPSDKMRLWAFSVATISNVAVPTWDGVSVSFEPDSDSEAITDEDPPDLVFAHLCSPGDLVVYDRQGNATGLVNGMLKEEIPDSGYEDGMVIVLNPLDSYYYQVVGTDYGSYGLKLTSLENGEVIAFTAIDIPTSLGAVHEYTVDWEALSAGEEGVIVMVDSDGDGVCERTLVSDSVLTAEEFTQETPDVQVSVDDLVNVSSGRAAYDRWTGQFSVNVMVENTSDTVIDSPVWLVIESISNTSVTLAYSDGETADGKEYIDLSELLIDGELYPEESVSTRIYFNNPQRKQFTFEAGVRGVILP